MQPNTVALIIATCNRPDELVLTVRSVLAQVRMPDEVIVVDSSEGQESEQAVQAASTEYPITYLRTTIRSAAQQRNIGARRATGSLLMFIDDDVTLHPDFVERIVSLFDADADERVGGISGTLDGETYAETGTINSLLLRIITGAEPSTLAGRVVGPAINFTPRLVDDDTQPVDWMPGVCATYRRDAFCSEWFPEHYTGYSYGEDLHLSLRIAKHHRLLNAPRACVVHRDGGKSTRRDWVGVGESIVLHRYEIMTCILNRRSLGMHMRLFAYECLYHGVIALRAFLRSGDNRYLRLQFGRVLGFAKVLKPRRTLSL